MFPPKVVGSLVGCVRRGNPSVMVLPVPNGTFTPLLKQAEFFPLGAALVGQPPKANPKKADSWKNGGSSHTTLPPSVYGTCSTTAHPPPTPVVLDQSCLHP